MENKQAGVSSTSAGNYPYSREHQNLQNEFTRAYITRPLEPSDVDVNTARYSPRSQFAQYPRAYNQHNKNILRQQFYQNVHPHYSNKQEIYDQKATTSYADNIYQNSLKQSDDSIKKVNVETKPVLDSSESQYEILLHRHQKKLQNASATSESSSVAGTNQSFQSPLVKRKPDAPITLQGWLHKQGSDGLHLWRRRWFVLSEYCLFYYKSQEEHKLLGSILLPSYKVSICGSEDKVYRKFSFKLEHLNMRTYILAASSQNSMVQWLRAVSMACVASIPAVPSKTNYPIDQKPAHQVRSAQPETTSVPVKETWSGSPRQPLYANAPPKPKRLFDDIDWNAVSKYHGTSQVIPDPRLYYSNCEQLAIHNSERRTPDTYGRSNQFKPYSDYEVLQGSKLYKPPFSPEMFYKRMYSKDSINLWQPSNVTMRNNAYTLPDYNRTNAQETRVIRPRSADFLDYHENDIDNDTRYLERPKSSLDIITKNDSYFCSEESYAEKIRQSALYLQQKSLKQVPFKKAAIDQFNLPIESNYIDTINSNEIENKKITGDKKREESMMRLLEWKQRMLQSPLRRNSRGFPEHSLRRHQQYLHPRDRFRRNSFSSDDEASGSMSMSSLRSLQPSTPWLMSQSENSTKAYHQNQLMCAHETDSRSSTPQNFMINDHKKEVQLIDNNDVTDSQYYKDIQQTISSNVPNVWKLSAGELLGRTYEELVLLLIQLRRQNVNDFQAIECCYSEINSLQLMLSLKDTVHKLDDLLRLDQLKRHLVQLKKQYEKSKPLLNLVENMVKLGSLYRQGRNPNRSGQEIPQAELIAFNRIMQERWVKAEEERDWYRVNPNHSLLNKFQDTLTDNNDSYEQDPYLVYQKSPHLQKNMGNSSNIIPKVCEPDPRRNSVTLECELKRVQDLVGDLNRQRQELNRQVSHLIGKSQNLIQQIQTPTTQDSSTSKKTSQSSWLETDLDYSAGEDKQMTITSDYSSLNSNTLYHSTPLTNISDDSTINSSDTELQSLYCPLQEKQGIKTVRIVKRESERRQRDREKLCSAGTSIASSTPLTECQWDVLETEDTNISKDESLICDTSDYTTIDNSITSKSYASSKYSPISTKSVQFETKLKSASPEYSNNRYSESEPQSTLVLEKFKSETAQKIINELTDYNKKQTVSRRTVPKEKRRHYTAPHQSIATSTSRLEDIHVLNKEIDRAKDDLDMERALRSRFNPPDVVRSTLSHRELRYNEGVIDSVLGTPNKIVIPERYIPEQSPQLSAEEQQRRLQKVESIKKMLSDSTSVVTTFSLDSTNNKQPSASISEEKKQREHLLQLNQILAKQVIEMSKIITEKALLTLPLTQAQQNYEEEDLSPMTPLPLYQQRENYYS